jgi:mono/diheme cytochrome c family protein
VIDSTNPFIHTDRVLRRLLGPAGPELTCEQCFELLDQYVELELAAAGASADEQVPGMRAHLEGCAACHEEHDSLLALVKSDTRV